MGLIGGHAYSLLSAYEGENGLKLIKLRNPWGQHEWNGDWSDNSKLWTPQLKKELNYVDANDGSFWMSFDDFQKCYSRF